MNWQPRWRWGGLCGLVVVLAGLGVLADGLPFSRAASPPSLRVSALRCANNGGSIGVLLYAGPSRLVSETDIPVCARGALTVTFAGDPATGCAAQGLCAYSGTESWQPVGVGDLSIATSVLHGRRTYNATLAIGIPANPVLAAVQRSVAGAAGTACHDHAQSPGGFFTLPVRGGRVDIGLGHSYQPLLGTRCAGPVDADLGVFPHQAVTLRRLERGGLTIDVTGIVPFAAHGFSGTVRSTVVLVLGRPRRQSGPQHPTVPPGLTPTRFTSVTYRITHLSGGVTAAVHASAVSSACDPLDACGLGGTITVTPRPGATGSAVLSASARASRPQNDLLTALGLANGGRAAGVSVGGGGEAQTSGMVTAALTGPGGACTDQVRLRQTLIEMQEHAGRLVVSVAPGRSQAADPLRTRCPGPALDNRWLTSASLPLSVLRRPGFTVRLRGRAFHDGPYAVTTRSTLSVTLRRGRVHTQIVPFLRRR